MVSESEYWLTDGTFTFLAPHESVPMPWWGSKSKEMTLATKLLRIPG